MEASRGKNVDSADAANVKNIPPVEETGEAKDYRLLYRLITAVSAVFLSAGLYMLLDSLLLNAYGARSSGIITASFSVTGLCVAFGLRHLYRKAVNRR
jgi:hypothetical protein